MCCYLDRAISDGWAWGPSCGRGRVFAIRKVPGRCVVGAPSRARHERDPGEFGFHRPCLLGRRAIAFRPPRLRVRQLHASQPILTKSKAPSGFAMHQFPCVTRWLPKYGLTGFRRNHDGRLAMCDDQ